MNRVVHKPVIRVHGLLRKLGSLEVGKKADLLILDGPDYRHLAYHFGANLVQTVVKAGRIVSQ